MLTVCSFIPFLYTFVWKCNLKTHKQPFHLQQTDSFSVFVEPMSSCCLPQWLNPRTMVLMDSGEKVHVVDRPSQEELETLDLAEVQLVYNSSHFKSLATGGNVSQALVRNAQMKIKVSGALS